MNGRLAGQSSGQVGEEFIPIGIAGIGLSGDSADTDPHLGHHGTHGDEFAGDRHPEGLPHPGDDREGHE